uniref:Uncharacterized protein n=1 Tax=Micrurus corallinus TaxID=54390 RepID=A0A2D4GQU4_MICCO
MTINHQEEARLVFITVVLHLAPSALLILPTYNQPDSTIKDQNFLTFLRKMQITNYEVKGHIIFTIVGSKEIALTHNHQRFFKLTNASSAVHFQMFFCQNSP